MRQGEYGRALKKLTAVDKHFVDMVEDQVTANIYIYIYI